MRSEPRGRKVQSARPARRESRAKLDRKAIHLTGGDRAAAAQLALASALRDSQPVEPLKPTGQPLTVKEAAAALRVSTKRVYELSAAGELRTFRVGRALRISPEALDEYRRQGPSRRPEPFSGRPNRCL